MGEPPGLIRVARQRSLEGAAEESPGWVGACVEIAAALRASVRDGAGGALDAAVRQARQLTSSAMAYVEVIERAMLVLRAADGGDFLGAHSRAVERAPLHRDVIEYGRVIAVADVAVDERAAGSAEAADPRFGAVLVVPLPAPDRPLGTLTVCGPRGGQAFAPLDVRLATLLANHAALALDLEATRPQASSTEAYDEVEAVAQRLHDTVMQRLFATGLRLQGVAGGVTGQPAETLASAAQDLDDAMADIRSAIQMLRAAANPAATSLGAALLTGGKVDEPPAPVEPSG